MHHNFFQKNLKNPKQMIPKSNPNSEITIDLKFKCLEEIPHKILRKFSLLNFWKFFPDYDYDYYGYGDYRGGYADPYYDDYYGGFDDYYEGYGSGYGPGPRGRGRGGPPPPPPPVGEFSFSVFFV